LPKIREGEGRGEVNEEGRGSGGDTRMPSLPQGCVSRDEEVQGGIEMAGIKHKKVKPYSVEGFESFAKFCESDERKGIVKGD